MVELLPLVGLLLLLGLGVIASSWRHARIRDLARRRHEQAAEVSDAAAAEPIPAARSYLVRHRFAALG